MSEQAAWISVDQLAHGFGENNLSPVDDLAGQHFDFHFENGWVISHEFISADELIWKIGAEGEAFTETYSAIMPREGIYFVDFEKKSEPGTTVSLVMDLEKGIATAVLSVMPSREEIARPMLDRALSGDKLRSVQVDFLRARLDAPFESGERAFHAQTDELVGRRVEYAYSQEEVYEHIYLNNEGYTWHCLKGSEAGLCDTDYCSYRKIDDAHYLFVWEEKVIPTVGVLLIDFEAMRSCGKLVGYQGTTTDALSNFSVGAKATVLNTTHYPCLSK
ncbi:MAG: MoaF C-terminal domain-containing protein [Pseudomonadales bacterium]